MVNPLVENPVWMNWFLLATSPADAATVVVVRCADTGFSRWFLSDRRQVHTLGVFVSSPQMHELLSSDVARGRLIAIPAVVTQEASAVTQN
tara:strand:- start:8466 stop:8738 length:273 start_codon:yes stop_codon:yes gene_type:complete